MGPATHTVPTTSQLSAAHRRPSAARMRELAGSPTSPEVPARRSSRPSPPSPPQNVAPQRLARATAELRRARLAVAQIVVALRVARAEGRSMEIVWLRRRLVIERQLFHAALAELRQWRAVVEASPPPANPS